MKYRNQIRTCRHCARPLHIGQTCSDARKQLSGEINNRLTIAQVLANASTSTLNDQSQVTPSCSTESATVTQKQHKTNTICIPDNKSENNQQVNTTKSIVVNKAQTRSSSLSRLRNHGDSQTAGPSRNESANFTIEVEKMDVAPLTLAFI